MISGQAAAKDRLRRSDPMETAMKRVAVNSGQPVP